MLYVGKQCFRLSFISGPTHLNFLELCLSVFWNCVFSEFGVSIFQGSFLSSPECQRWRKKVFRILVGRYFCWVSSCRSYSSIFSLYLLSFLFCSFGLHKSLALSYYIYHDVPSTKQIFSFFVDRFRSAQPPAYVMWTQHCMGGKHVSVAYFYS